MPDWLIYSLILVIMLAGCSPLQPLATAEPPTPLPSSTPAPTATPDPSSLFEQQLETARQDGYLPASYTGDPAGAPVLVSEINLAPLRDLGLLPLSLDGLELGRTDGEQLVLPHLEAIPYRSPETGELAIYSFSDTDGTWNYYTNHGGPVLKVPVSLPSGLADLVGVYNAPDRDPALVAAKLMPDGSIQIIPIVFTEDESVAFSAQSVIIDGQEVFYNQLTSAWEMPPPPTEIVLPGVDADSYETDEYGGTLAIKDGQIVGISTTQDGGEKTIMKLGERGAVMILDKNGDWQNLMVKIQGNAGSQEVNPKSAGIYPTPHGYLFEGKNDQPSVLLDNDGNILQLNYAVATLASGEKFVWDKDAKTWQDGFKVGDDGALRIYRPTSGRYEQFTTSDNQKIPVDQIVPLGNGQYAFVYEGKLSGTSQADWTVTKSYNDMAPIGFDVYALNPSTGNVEKVPNFNYYDWAFSQKNMIIKNEKTFPAHPNLKFTLVINPASIGRVSVEVLDSSAPRRFMEEAIFLRLERDNKLPAGVTDRDSFREYLQNGGSVTIPQLRAWNIQTSQVEDMFDVPIKEIVIYSYTEGFDPPPPVRTRFGLAHDEPKTFDFIIDKPNNRLIVLNQCVDFSYLKKPSQRHNGFRNMIMGTINQTAFFLNTDNLETENRSKSGRMITIIVQNIMDKIQAIILQQDYFFKLK